MEMILSTLLIHIERTPQQMHCFSMCTCTLLKIPVSIVTLIDYYSLCPTFCLFLTLVGNCLVNVIITQKYIKIRSRVIFSWLRVNKSDSIKGLQNSAEDYLISVFFFQLNDRIPSKQALYLLTLGEMSSTQDKELGTQDSQWETQHDLSPYFDIHKC